MTPQQIKDEAERYKAELEQTYLNAEIVDSSFPNFRSVNKIHENKMVRSALIGFNHGATFVQQHNQDRAVEFTEWLHKQGWRHYDNREWCQVDYSGEGCHNPISINEIYLIFLEQKGESGDGWILFKHEDTIADGVYLVYAPKYKSYIIMSNYRFGTFYDEYGIPITEYTTHYKSLPQPPKQ